MNKVKKQKRQASTVRLPINTWQRLKEEASYLNVSVNYYISIKLQEILQQQKIEREYRTGKNL